MRQRLLPHFLYPCEDFVNEQDDERALPPDTKKHIARAIFRPSKPEKPQFT